MLNNIKYNISKDLDEEVLKWVFGCVRFKDTLCFRLCVLGVQKQNETLKTIHHFQYIANTEL